VDGREFRPGLPCQKVVSSSSGTSANSGGILEWGSGLSCFAVSSTVVIACGIGPSTASASGDIVVGRESDD
jgi:hypothetical protein